MPSAHETRGQKKAIAVRVNADVRRLLLDMSNSDRHPSRPFCSDHDDSNDLECDECRLISRELRRLAAKIE